MFQPTIFSHLPIHQTIVPVSLGDPTERLAELATRGAHVVAARRAGGRTFLARFGILPASPVSHTCRTSHAPAR